MDVHVGNAIMHKCVCGLLRKKSRVLVTHQVQYMHQPPPPPSY